MVKRTFDLVLAASMLLVLMPVIVCAAIAIRIDSPGPVLYRGPRVGKQGRLFSILKFRTMVHGADAIGPSITRDRDPRITRLGAVLRRTKLDELPQLFNVLAGQMSVVGPRPEHPDFVKLYDDKQLRLLDAKPGLTSPASLTYRNEASLLNSPDAVGAYINDVMPAKLALDLKYLDDHSFLRDFEVVARTAATVLGELPPTVAAAGFIRKWVPWMVADAVVIAGAFYGALLLRFLDGTAEQLKTGVAQMNLAVLPLILIYVSVNAASGLDRRMWRYASGSDVRAILASSLISTAVGGAADLIAPLWLGHRPLPLSVVVIGGVLAFCGQVAVRYRTRLVSGIWRWGFSNASSGNSRTRALIYGAGESGQQLARRLVATDERLHYEIVGFVDDDRSKLGKQIHGIPVLGSGSDLTRLVASSAIDLIMLAISKVTGEQLRRILSASLETTARIRIIPSVLELVERSTSNPLLREVRVEDLLGRQPVNIDHAACEAVIGGKVVMVTGGCGSVGSELCRQIAKFEPQLLVIVDNNESGLFDLAIELRNQFGHLPVRAVVADVTDEPKMERAFREFAPAVIFHAAAYKHVPLMETYPEEAVRVNVGGTLVVLDKARAHGAGLFVLVSTDKAVKPISVMGATKRVAELLTMDDGIRPRVQGDGRSQMVTTAVRFGNVLGTRGSVVPTFAKQIELGGPVTVTHPEMTRYFMDISEAATLIVQAAALTRGADLFMLDMGERIRIDDLARKMIRLRGLRPEVDIPIVYTGFRPGEKLHEELSYEQEEKQPTQHPQIWQFTNERAQQRGRALRRSVDRLLRLASTASQEEVLAELMALTSVAQLSKIDPTEGLVGAVIA